MVQWFFFIHWLHTLRWRHIKRDGISNHQPHDCLLNCLFRLRLKETSKLCATGLCAGNLTVTGKRASNVENVSIWWCHHDVKINQQLLWIYCQHQLMWLCWIVLTQWGWDNMAAISQMTLSNTISLMKMLEFWSNFHWSSFLRVQSIIFKHWFR